MINPSEARSLGILLILLYISTAAILQAQEVSGSISGRVTDTSGAMVPGAEVQALHVDTGTVRRTVSGRDGLYSIPDLPIGNYEISITLTGFRRALKRGIELHVSERLGIDVTLEVGGLTQEVSVTETLAQVHVESSEEGSLISGEQVRELQLNGRSFMTLLELVPGVASNMSDRADPNSSPSVSINGARSTGANFNIDGGNNADVIVGGSALSTFNSVESIAEFTVLTSTFSAEYGRAGFSQINVVTKSGTKKFHGSLYEFFRNDALDATDYFSHQVLPLKLNNFGYTLGGPVPLPYNRNRNKTFFFFTQEFNRISMRQSAINTTVPLPEYKQGDFSGLGAGRDGVFGTTDDPVVDYPSGVGFPNGKIPASRLDSNAKKLLTLFPDPNFKGPGTINYTSAAPSKQDWREEVIRIDHHFSPSFKSYGRYVQDSAFVQNPYGGSGTTNFYTPWPGIAATQSDRPGKNLVLSATHVISNTLVNQSSFNWSRRLFDMFATSTAFKRTALGITIPELFPENKGDIIPAITLGSGYGALNVQGAGHKELFTVELSDTVSKIAGRHMLSTGIYYFYGGNYEQKFAPRTNGGFSFSTAFAKHPVANMLLGLPSNYQEVEKTVWTDTRFASIEAFVQDNFKATPRLTLNLGLRYAAYLSPYDRENILSNFLRTGWDRSKAPQVNAANGTLVPNTGDLLNGIFIAGKNSPFGRRVTENSRALWGPRIGLAWAPFRSKSTAIRAGYGIYHTRPMLGAYLNTGLDNPPFSKTITLSNPLLNSPSAGLEAASSPPGLSTLGLPMSTPTVQQWSLGVQREIFRKAILNVSYVGSHGTHLMRPLNVNSPEPGAAGANPGSRINALRPYLGYGDISERQSSGSSVYHSMQVSLNRRVTGKLTAGVAYTWGKSIDDGSSERGSGDTPPDNRNIRAERGPSDFDRTQIFTSNFIWRLPPFARGPLAKTFGLKAILDGWQVSGIARMWSGTPFDVALSQDVAGIGGTQNQRPDVVDDTRGPRTLDQWFNRSAFARPATGKFGNMGRNSLRLPGVNKWDLALFKNFKLGEGKNLQFRGEMFNAFNHPSFDTVGRSLNTTATGVNPLLSNFAIVTGTRDARVVQFALKIGI